MSLMEKLKGFLGSKAPNSVKELESSIAKLQEALIAAKKNAQASAAEHDEQVLSLIVGGDSHTLEKSRLKVADAEASVKELESAITAFERKLRQAREKENQSETGKQWEKAKNLSIKRVEAMQILQELADEFATAHEAVLQLNEEFWHSLPERPTFRPQECRNEISELLLLYLYGKTNGKLGHSSLSPFVIQQRPSLVDMARDTETLVFASTEERVSQ